MNEIDKRNDLEKFYQGLKRLFTGLVIIRHIQDKHKRLKVIDSSNIQKALLTNRYNKLYKSQNIDVQSLKSYGYNTTRLNLFRDYEAMDKDPIISSALDVYAELATVKNLYDLMLTILSLDEDVVQILLNLFYDILNILFNLPS